MGNTIIENNTMNAIINACRTISSKKSIDWEQRRYEIAKAVIPTCRFKSADEMADVAVQVADALIARLKNDAK